MTTDQDDLRREINELRARIAALESRLGLSPLSHVPPALPVTAPSQPPSPPVPMAPQIVPPPITTHAQIQQTPEPARLPPHMVPEAVRKPAIQRRAPSEDQPGSSSGISKLESLVGGRWFAVLGALGVIIAIALFVKLAYDQGWLKVPPVYRCAAGALFGVLLIGAAEFLRKRIGPWGAFGGYAAGLGSIYVSVYAAYRLYKLFDPTTCFVLLALTAVVGVFIGVRARLAAVSFVAILGGYLAPFLLYDAHANTWGLPTYLLLLMAIGLAVAWRGGAGFHALRFLVWIGTLLLGLVWSLGVGSKEPWLNLTFLLTTWTGMQGELILSIRKGALSFTNRRAIEGVSLAGSMVATAWFGLLATLNLRATGLMADWMGPLMATAGSLLGAFVAGQSASPILDSPRNPAQRLGACMALQAGSMGMVAVALALSGPAEAIAWLALAAGGMFGGWRSQLLGVRLYAFALLAVGSLRLVLYDSWHTDMGLPVVYFMGLHLTAWAALMCAAALLWLIAVRLGLPSSAPTLIRVLVSVLGCMMLVGSLAHQQSETGSMIVAWVLLLAAVGASRSLLPGAWLDVVATGLLAVPINVWILTECTRSWPVEPPPLMYAGFLIGLLLTGACITAWAWLRRGAAGPPHIALIAGLVAVVIAFADSSLEVARVVQRLFEDSTSRRAAISLWWGVFASGLLAGGFLKARPWVRHAGLALLGAAAIKVVAYDLAGVSQVWRIASFLGLGLLMLGVAVVYARATQENSGSA